MIYNEIVFPLQFVASRFATWTLETLNLFPIMREGNVLIMPGMSLEVVEACSGIRSLMSLLALAAGFGYLVERSVPGPLDSFPGHGSAAIVSNGTRVMITAIMANYIGPKAAEGFMHEFSGWVIFVVATVLFLALLQFDDENPQDAGMASRQDAPPVPLAREVNESWSALLGDDRRSAGGHNRDGLPVPRRSHTAGQAALGFSHSDRRIQNDRRLASGSRDH